MNVISVVWVVCCVLLFHVAEILGVEEAKPTSGELKAAVESPVVASGGAAGEVKDSETVKVSEPMKVSDVADLTARIRKSVVVINVKGRTEARHAIGSGFIIDSQGLIATNLHVIGESRPIEVQMEDGRRLEVSHVQASDRHFDLAILKVKGENLPALPLGNSELLRQGEEVLAVGNPLGLELSVVTGVISALREIEGRKMIQVAMPIEQGNSGGPLLDRQGNVQGIITLKSLRSPNLGFAIPVSQLKPLIEKPNPIPMERWMTMEQVDPRDWKTLFGARWQQRSGKIQVEGLGDGFGGRSLCLNQQGVLKRPFEISVEVKLNGEEGAAGLVFHADGDQKHYGFYPSGGKLRLSRFDGPDVFQWHVLEEISSAAYRPGEWNLLQVKIKEGEFECYVNHELVTRSQDSTYTEGKAGLAKFRETKAEFRHFQAGESLQATVLEEGTRKELNSLLKPAESIAFDQFRANPGFSRPEAIEEIRLHARKLEQQARDLREISSRLHEERLRSELRDMVDGPAEKFSLSRGALLISRLDNEDTDVDYSLRMLDRMGEEIKGAISLDATEKQKRETLHRFLFEEWGFHGSRHDYYVRENSYLDQVIEDREGLPITLAVVYLELSKKIGMTTHGIPLPGHFVVSHTIPNEEPIYIDVFDRGKELSSQEIQLRILSVTGNPPTSEQTAPAGGKQILERMTRNLLGLAQDEEDLEGMNRYVETLLILNPESADHHVKRALLRFQRRDFQGALVDIDWLEQSPSPEIDQGRVQELRSLVERGLRNRSE